VHERVQCKREREKAQHVAMTQEERDEKKRRENYHMRKAETALAAGSRGGPLSDFPFLNSVLPFFSLYNI
jgi:hypothetical protein